SIGSRIRGDSIFFSGCAIFIFCAIIRPLYTNYTFPMNMHPNFGVSIKSTYSNTKIYWAHSSASRYKTWLFYHFISPREIYQLVLCNLPICAQSDQTKTPFGYRRLHKFFRSMRLTPQQFLALQVQDLQRCIPLTPNLHF